MDGLGDEEAAALLKAAAVVHAVRQRVRTELRPRSPGHDLPTTPGTVDSVVDDLLGASASARARAAWRLLDAAVTRQEPEEDHP